ncbi:MAG: hypothetical protein HYX90_01535, partial [Chloroflexi bacterium]|nr:hypothetical protein [Chloroflexota bacterium]
ILGRGAVKDTYNLLSDGIVQVLRALAGLEGVKTPEWAREHGLERYFGSSLKGEAAVNWDDEKARRVFLNAIVADADRVLELARQAQGQLASDEQKQVIVESADLLGQLLLQDVERKDDGASLKAEVSRDRIPSVHDPEIRHGHKSSRKRFDGHKAAVAVDTETQLITAVEVLPGNAPDNTGALELVGDDGQASPGGRLPCFGFVLWRPSCCHGLFRVAQTNCGPHGAPTVDQRAYSGKQGLSAGFLVSYYRARR